jgi:acyl-CoA reductase-like NAD-dependent aldehyde dehydrogenase
MIEHRLLIDGKLEAGDFALDVVNPATGAVYTKVARASKSQMEAAVAAAKAAFPSWARTSVEERRRCVNALADAIQADRDSLARALVQEQGKPLSEALDEIDWTVIFIRYYATIDLPIDIFYEDDVFRMEGHHKPLGVVLGIAPWNLPVFILALKLVSAVLTGNTFIAKPAPTTPVTTLMIGALLQQIFPAGVVNMLVDQNDLGAALTEHPDVSKISFTGSTATGQKVAASASSSFKRISLELGGNDASIVMGDVNVDAVAEKIFAGAFFNAGQGCIVIKRVYAHADIYDSLTAKLAELAEAAVLGNGLEQGTQIGPMQNLMQYEKAKAYLEHAHRDGKVIAGGLAPEGKGYFIQPTIVRDIDDTSPLVTEEQFAPILPVVRFEDVADAMANANASQFGLGGSVWSGDKQRAYDLANEMQTGTVWINHHLHIHPAVPLGGAKRSGVGVDYGADGLKEYTQMTTIRVLK